MPVPSPRNKILPARGNFADLQGNLGELLEGEICYAFDQDQYYQKEGGVLVAVGATKAQGILAESALQSGDNISELINDMGYLTAGDIVDAPVRSVNGQVGDVVLDADDVGAPSDAEFATLEGRVLANEVAHGNNLQKDAEQDNRLTGLETDVSNIETALDSKADLVNGVVPNSQLPSIAITEYLGEAADETAMLALDGQKGDWCIRTDVSTTWVVTGDDASLLSSWTELATPAAPVTSVNGYTGTVALSASDVGAATTAQGAKADTATQPGDNVSTLTNDAGYITDPGVSQIIAGTNVTIDPVGGTGAVTINATGGAGGGVEEAPTDGQQYARQNAGWSVVAAGDNSTTINYSGAAAWGKINADASIASSLNTATVTTSTVNTNIGYDVTFTTPMPSAEYAVVGSALNSNRVVVIQTQDANGFRFELRNASNNGVQDDFSFAVHALNALPPQGGTGTDAWGVFSGSDPGTIQGSFNIASITRNSVGNYSVVFTNPMPDTQYAVVGSCSNAAADTAYTFLVTNKSSTGFDYVTLRDVGQAGDGTISYSDQAASFTVNASNATLPLTITEDQIAALIQNPVLSAWGSVNSSDGSLAQSFNIASCSKAGAVYTITFTNPLQTADYAISAVAQDPQTAQLRVVTYHSKTTTGFQAYVRDTSGAGSADTDFSFTIAGTARNGTLGGGADAWGDIAGAAATPDADRVLGGFNIQSVQRTGDGQYTINFANDMPNTNYSVVASPVTGVNADRILVGTKQVDSFTLSYFDTVDAGVNANFNFAVFATDGNAGGFWVREGSGSDEVLKPLNSDATIEAAALTDGTTTKTMADVLAGGGGGGGIEEAPVDGNQYARQNAGWSIVSGGGGSGDNITYNGAAAWAQFDGTSAIGTNCTILNSSNVDRVEHPADGVYEVFFTNSMPDANYATFNNANLGLANNNVTAVSPAGKANSVDSYTIICVAAPDSIGTGINCKFVSTQVQALNALPPQGGTGTDAWAQVGGVTDDGPAVIRGSFNVDSVTRTSSGKYEVVFTNPMPNSNYAVNITGSTFGANVQSNATVQNITAAGFLLDLRSEPDNAPADTTFCFTVNATNAVLPATITEDQIAALIQNPVLSAWGAVQDDGTIDGSFNIASVDNSSVGRYDIVFANAMSNANYAITATEGSASLKASFGGKTETGFSVFIRNTNGSTHTAADGAFSFQVAGTARNGTLGGGADAWASTTAGSVISGGFNLTVTDGGAGLFEYTFENALPNANYAVVISQSNSSANKGFADVVTASKTATGFSVATYNSTGALTNRAHDLSVFATDGNAGGFWVKTGDELAPLSATADISVGGGNISLNADGSATFAAGDITLNADGSSLFKGPLEIQEDSSPWIQVGYGTGGAGYHRFGWDSAGVLISADPNDDVNNSRIGFSVDGTTTAQVDDSGFKVGGTLPASPNITLNANGSAEFSEDIEVGSVGPNGYSVQLDAAVPRVNIQTNNNSLQLRADSNGDALIFSGTGALICRSSNSGSNGVKLNASATSWTSASDFRMKQALVPITDGLTKVSTLRAVTGRYLTDEPDVSRAFLVAQDVQQVLPEAVDSSNPDELGLRYTEIIPLLVSALQDAKTRIETLEAEVASLKGGSN